MTPANFFFFFFFLSFFFFLKASQASVSDVKYIYFIFYSLYNKIFFGCLVPVVYMEYFKSRVEVRVRSLEYGKKKSFGTVV